MAHLDLLSRSRRGAAAYRLTSIVPLVPPGPTHYPPVSGNVRSSLTCRGSRSTRSGLSAVALCIRSASRCSPRARVTRTDNSFATRKRAPVGDTTRPLSPYRHRRTWRRRLHTSTGSFPLEQILEPFRFFLAREVNPWPRYPLVSSALPPPSSPGTPFIPSAFLDLTTCLQKDSHALHVFCAKNDFSTFTFIWRYIIETYRKEYKCKLSKNWP